MKFSLLRSLNTVAHGVRWPRVARLVNKVGAIIVKEVGSKNLARISHHLPRLVSLPFSLSLFFSSPPSMEFIALRMGRHGIASSRSQVAIFDHYGRLSGPREPIFKPKMLPITNKHLCTFAVLLSSNIIIPSFHPFSFSSPPSNSILSFFFFIISFPFKHIFKSYINSSKLGFHRKKIKQSNLIKATTMFHRARSILQTFPIPFTRIFLACTARPLTPFPFYNLHRVGDREIADDRCTTTHENACRP